MTYPTPASYAKPIKPVRDITLGYYYFMDGDHPLADDKGRVWYHRHVASVAACRWVTNVEVVHHLDEDRAHNDPLNLEIKPSQRVHAAEHAREVTARRGGFSGRIDNCAACGREFFRAKEKNRYCSPECHQRTRRKLHPTREELASMLQGSTTSEVAKKYGVSEAAVRKHRKRLGL